MAKNTLGRSLRNMRDERRLNYAKRAVFMAVGFIFAGGVLLVSGCSSAPKTKTTADGRALQGGMPLFIQNAVKNVPTSTLVGIGSAKIGAAGFGAGQNNCRRPRPHGNFPPTQYGG